jgi:hypothetical protein
MRVIQVEYRIAIVSISTELKAVAVVRAENASTLSDLIKARPTMVANLVDLHRQSTSELQRGIPNTIALEASIQGYVQITKPILMETCDSILHFSLPADSYCCTVNRAHFGICATMIGR